MICKELFNNKTFRRGRWFPIFVPLLFLTQLLSGIENIWVRPAEIQFNYEEGYANDALGICNASGGAPDYTPEWFYDNEENNTNFAYIKSQTSRQIVVRFDSNYPQTDSMHLIINLTITSGDGIGTVCNLFVPYYSPMDYITMTLDGVIPNSVGIRTFTWKWDIYAISNNITNYCSALTSTYTSHMYYTLLAAPQTPVEAPWSSVLDLACSWAANRTSEDEIVADITQNAYNYFGQTKQYNSGITHTAGTTFYLSSFLIENYVDCQDMSAVVQVFTWMVGGSNTEVITINDKYGGIENFFHKSIKPIGQDWTGIALWNFHQVGWYNNVYDACIQVNINNPRIPINENIDINGSYKTDLVDSGDWVPKVPFHFTSVY